MAKRLTFFNNQITIGGAMTRTFYNLLVVLVCVSSLPACGDRTRAYNPTEPTPEPIPVQMPVPVPTPGPMPTPEPALVSLTGTVRSKAGSPLNGAPVKVLDGVNAGKTTTTNGLGAYRFDGLTPGNGNLSASAVGYQESRAGVYINDSTLDFVLEPASYAGIWVGNGTGTASDGSPVSVEIELQVVGDIGNFVVDFFKIDYKFRYDLCHRSSPIAWKFRIPVIENEFSMTLRQFDVYVYTPTSFRGIFSPTEVRGEVTLVRTSYDKYRGCPASATIEWSGTKR